MKKQKRKMQKVICKNCCDEFDKAISEIKRTEKRGGNHYCSLKCCGDNNSKYNLGKYLGHGNAEFFKGKTRADEYTPFREFIRRAQQRKLLGDLSVHDIKEQWEKQNGICPYTGIKLKIKHKKRDDVDLFELASLNRIDSNKLYEKDNVEFVSTPINFMKNSMSKEKTIEYCKKIALFWKMEQ